MLERIGFRSDLERGLKRAPVVALVGPRQCGKSTLARAIASDSPQSTYLDLENPRDLSRLDQPLTALSDLRGLVVLDEIQYRPDLFPVLRVLADRPRTPARFLILGSASPTLLRQSSESLAGRLETIVLSGFDANEVTGAQSRAQKREVSLLQRHWERGGFPRSFLAKSAADSVAWRRNFVQTYLSRDLPSLGISIPAATLLRFWTMLAHWHGQIWNAAEFARSLGTGEVTARRYLDLLTDLYLVRQLQPWHANIAKRQVKSPKVYVRDTGLLHSLLGIESRESLLGNPRVGASWEGWAIENLIAIVRPDECAFWATHQGAELDLLLRKGTVTVGVEVKRADGPTLTPSMRNALADLSLDRIVVLYPGTERYKLAERVEAVPSEILGDRSALMQSLGMK